MALSLKHKFVSLKVDGGDTSLIRPSNWNDEHDLLGQAYSIPFRNAGTTGAMVDVPIGEGLYFDATAGKLDINLVGLIGFFAGSLAGIRPGWIKANGALVSRTTYANLFAAIGTVYGAGDGSTTFALPDMRGYFPRGWDDGRGIDTGRVFGSSQADTFGSHAHSASSGFVSNDHQHYVSANTGGRSADHSHSTWAPTGSGPLNHDTSDEGDRGVSTGWNNQTSGESGDHVHGFSAWSGGISANHTHGITVNAAGGTETRPKNVALLACIKY